MFNVEQPIPSSLSESKMDSRSTNVRLLFPTSRGSLETLSTSRPRPKSRTRNGFTLIEVVIAVVILAAALITILGLQSSIMRRTLRDEGRQQAMLLSRSLLAAIENNIDSIDVQDKTVPAEELLNTLLVHAPSRLEQDKKPLFEFLAHISVEMWGIPNFKDDAMRRVRINIFTEDLPEDSFDITFFIPNEEREPG